MGPAPFPTRQGQRGSGRNETFISLFLPPSQPFWSLPPRSRNPSAPERRSGAGSQLLPRAQPAAARRDIPSGARAARRTPASGRTQLLGCRAQLTPTPQSQQQGNREQPALHRLVSCRKHLADSFRFRVSRVRWVGSLHHPLIQMLLENRKLGGEQMGVLGFGLSVCRSYSHGRNLPKPDEGVSA